MSDSLPNPSEDVESTADCDSALQHGTADAFATGRQSEATIIRQSVEFDLHADQMPPCGAADSPIDRSRVTMASPVAGLSSGFVGSKIDRSRVTAPAFAADFAQRSSNASFAAVPLSSGMQLCNNRYVLKTVIGSGGMGVVFRAFDANRNEEIAVKALNPSLIQSEKAIERFLAEGKISSSLSHPNIVAVYDVEKDHDAYFITMQFLEGGTLRQDMELRRTLKNPFTVDDVRRILLPVCDALTYAHTMTVHRDVKPENVFLCEDGSVKLMDFGIARVQTSAQMTTNGIALGTAYYMAPEQLRTPHLVDHRADQFALAVIVYEMLAGELPTGRAQPLSALRQDVRRGLSNAVDRALSVKPHERFESIDAFARVLSGEQKFKAAPGTGISRKTLVFAAALLLLVAGGWGYRAFGINKEMKESAAKAEGARLLIRGENDMIAGNWTQAKVQLRAARQLDPSNELASEGLRRVQTIMNGLATKQAELDRKAAEQKAELERAAAEQKAERDRASADQAERERQAAAQRDQERMASQQKSERDAQAADQANRERIAAEQKAERYRLAAALEKIKREAAEAQAKLELEQVQRAATERAKRLAQELEERLAKEKEEASKPPVIVPQPRSVPVLAKAKFTLGPGESTDWLDRTSGWHASGAGALRYRVYLDNSNASAATISKGHNEVLPPSKTIRFQAVERNQGTLVIELDP